MKQRQKGEVMTMTVVALLLYNVMLVFLGTHYERCMETKDCPAYQEQKR